MGKIQNPRNGGNILDWAKQVTAEVNSQSPTGGKGIKVKKSGAGTSYSIDENSMPFPDSMPHNIGGELNSASESDTRSFATTYSLQKDSQNSFSLFQFSSLSTVDDYRTSDLVSVDFVLRDRMTDYSVLSSPTVRYGNVYKMLSTVFTDGGDPDNDEDDTPPPLSSYLSCLPDSELGDDSKIVSKSIYHNSKGGLAVYHFEELSNSDIITSSDIENHKDNLMVLTRDESEDVPTMKYTPIEYLLSGSANVSGVTDSFNLVVSSEYNLSTHKFINYFSKFNFSNGLLVSVDTFEDDNTLSTVVFEAVEEQV